MIMSLWYGKVPCTSVLAWPTEYRPRHSHSVLVQSSCQLHRIFIDCLNWIMAVWQRWGKKTGDQGAVDRVRNPVSHPIQLMMIYLMGSQYSTFNGGLI